RGIMWSIQSQPNVTLHQLVDQILAAGEMSRQDHLQLTSILLAEQKLLDSDRNKINRIFDYISTGRLKLIN
ncbi:MAG TPA: hypothetical protein V6D34_15140, partial [Candidatus Sericytochromatia bacterium]